MRSSAAGHGCGASTSCGFMPIDDPMPWYAGSLRLIGEYLDGGGTIGDVLDLDAGGGHVVSALWHGIWSGQIECDLDRPLKRKTRIVVHEAEAVTA